MKKLVNALTIILLVTMVSCGNDNTATLTVVNQTNCAQNIFNGVNDNGSFMGLVDANSTVDLPFQLGSLNRSSQDFYADPVNCGFTALGETFFFIDMRKNQSTTILID